MLLKLWAKYKKSSNKKQENNLDNDANSCKYQYHPLLFHMIDSAAVAGEIWDKIISKSVKKKIRELFQLENFEITKSFVCFLTGLHDWGKATPFFQSIIKDMKDILKKEKLPFPTFIDKKIYHSHLTDELVKTHFNKKSQIKKPIEIKDVEFRGLIQYVLGGHHGFFQRNKKIEKEHLGVGAWIDLQLELLNLLIKFTFNNNSISEKNPLEINTILPDNEREMDKINALLIFISGFISVSDWIASNEIYFSYETPDFYDKDDITVQEIVTEEEKRFIYNYYKIAKDRAEESLKKLKWTGWMEEIRKMSLHPNKNNYLINKLEDPSPHEIEKEFKKIFPFIQDLRPLQKKLIKNIKHIKTPCLIIVEAPMGEGKTEVAFFSEYYLETKEQLSGAYIALPTQASANQMFNRSKDFLNNSHPDPNNQVNLHLVHGNAVLTEEYVQMQPSNVFNDFNNNENKKEEEQQPNLIASKWFTFKNRGIISPFGVGTVDQLLLGMLPSRHFFVRLFGMAGKTIIIDEVHAYDVYMSEILHNLLYWLRLIGSNVILLSATLPKQKRRELIQSFWRNHENSKNIPEIHYPNLTISTKDSTIVENFDVQIKKQDESSILFKFVKEEEILDKFKKIIDNPQWGKIAIICNKVKKAQSIFRILKNKLIDEKIDIRLLHSQFPYYQRAQLEENLLLEFGNINPNQMKKEFKILVSTQIIEQSLDLDFDLMITDLAPIDLILQRAGRLHRHEYYKNTNEPIIRANMFKRPNLWIIEPSLTDNIPNIPYPIYAKFILLKSYLSLKYKEENTISIPDDMESLIEQVYGEKIPFPSNFNSNQEEKWMESIKQAKKKWDEKNKKYATQAKYNAIHLPDYYEFFNSFNHMLDVDDNPKIHKSLKANTRITRPTIKIVPLYPINTESSNNKNIYSLRPINNSDEEYNESKKFIFNLNDKKLNEEQKKLILQHNIRFSNNDIISFVLKNKKSRPTNWKKYVLLRYIYTVKLSKVKDTTIYYFCSEKYRIFLTPLQGAIITKKEEIIKNEELI